MRKDDEMSELLWLVCVTHLALVQLFLELLHCVCSHHVTLQII